MLLFDVAHTFLFSKNCLVLFRFVKKKSEKLGLICNKYLICRTVSHLTGFNWQLPGVHFYVSDCMKQV